MRRPAVWPLIVVLLMRMEAVGAGPDRGAVGTDPPAASAPGLTERIDARFRAAWAQANVHPVARAEDGEFLRRVSLDLVGRIPTAAEARDFLDNPSPGKRAALVDRLLDSPAYAARAALLWRQLLLPDAGDEVSLGVGGLDAWLARKVDEDVPYDQVAREILEARLTGRNRDAMADAAFEPSPAAFFAARGGKPEVLAADTARAFLGLRLACAECHDHPFARWKREEFWRYAAFFAGVPRAADPNDDDAAAVRPVDPRALASRRELPIPGTAIVARATHLDGSTPDWRPRVDARATLAEWMTAPDNPYFARAAANRVWARFFGVGLIDPVDDLDATTDPALAALLDEVADQFRVRRYNLKSLIRSILLTEAYNLSSAINPAEPTPPSLFARMAVRGLSPGQFVDSIAQATGAEVGEARGRFLALFSDRNEVPTEAQTSILQALTLMNGSFVAAATDPRTGNVLGAIAEAPYLDTAGRVEMIYLAALARRPDPAESHRVVAFVDRRPTPADRSLALADAFWALLNGAEFRVNH